jgi:hypothetical protein
MWRRIVANGHKSIPEKLLYRTVQTVDIALVVAH